MLTKEDKKRIEAEEAYRAKMQKQHGKSEIGIGIKRQLGKNMLHVIGLLLFIVLPLTTCVVLMQP
ncbi:hypothetical protein [Pseudogemmobacter sonorensis]|uniref:hypothetical protein n=1 Tax=Pseudogemmobacter sonorensis TaxID=2989681 RepID=UPI00368CAAD5